MEQKVTESKHSMPMTLYFAICKYSCPEIVFSLLLKQPPDGIITVFIISALIGSIFSIMMIQTCINISIYSVQEFLVAEIKATVWHIGRPIALATRDNHMNALDANVDQYPWHYGFQCIIESMTSMLRQSPTTIPSLSRTVMCWLHFFCVAVRILITNLILSCKIMIQRISFFGKQLLRESVRLLREFLKHFWIISVQNTMHTLNGFITFAYSTLASMHEIP
jgi:hypothetical protein